MSRVNNHNDGTWSSHSDHTFMVYSSEAPVVTITGGIHLTGSVRTFRDEHGDWYQEKVDEKRGANGAVIWSRRWVERVTGQW